MPNKSGVWAGALVKVLRDGRINLGPGGQRPRSGGFLGV